MKTGLVVGLAVGVVFLSAGGVYSGMSYVVGSKYVEAYEEHMNKLRASGMAPQTTVEQGLFSTSIETKVKLQGPAGLVMKTEVDHQLSTDTILTAETTVEPDAQTAMLVKTFLRGTPKLWFGVEVKHDGTSEVNGHLEPIVTNPNPLFTLEMPKRATFRLTSDEEFLPTHMEFNVPSLLIGQNGGKSELSGLRLTTRGVVAGDKVTLKNKYAFKELKFQSKGRKPVVAGPLNLNLDLKDMDKALLLATSNANPMDLMQKSSNLRVTVPQSTLKTSFGDFALKGDVRLKTKPGNPVPDAKGSFDIAMPMGKQAMAFYGPQIASLLRAYVQGGMGQRKGDVFTTAMAIDGAKMTFNGVAVGPLTAGLPQSVPALEKGQKNTVKKAAGKKKPAVAAKGPAKDQRAKLDKLMKESGAFSKVNIGPKKNTKGLVKKSAPQKKGAKKTKKLAH